MNSSKSSKYRTKMLASVILYLTYCISNTKDKNKPWPCEFRKISSTLAITSPAI